MNSNLIDSWFNQRFPQSYLLRNPLISAPILAVFLFFFAILYRPFEEHVSRSMNYSLTIFFYSLIAGISVWAIIKMLRVTSLFSSEKKWTFAKEVAFIFILLLLLGVVIYFAAFILEPPADRWNFATFFDSLSKAFLIGILPFAFFTALNYHHWLNQKRSPAQTYDTLDAEPGEEKIRIRSALKKEYLLFYPSNLLYVESDGNYVNFCLLENEQMKKHTIRNSISNIEKQLEDISFLLRTHRAFIINLKKVKKKQGNSSGYKIWLEGMEKDLPVSRKNTRLFEQKFQQFHS